MVTNEREALMYLVYSIGIEERKRENLRKPYRCRYLIFWMNGNNDNYPIVSEKGLTIKNSK